MAAPHPVLRGLGGRLVLGLGLVVLVVVGGQIAFRTVLEQRVANLDALTGALTHRALAREIAVSASRLLGDLGHPGARPQAEQLEELLRDFDRAQQDLRRTLGQHGTAGGMLPLLLALEPRFRALHTAARTVVITALAEAPQHETDVLPDAEALSELGREVTRVMDRVVAQARWDVSWTVTRLYRVQVWILGAMTLALVLVAFIVFRPALATVGAAVGVLEERQGEWIAQVAGLEARCAERAAQLAEVTEAAAARTTFLSSLSRDVRRQMASLPAATALAEESDLTPTQRLYAASLQSLVERLERLARDVLDVTEIEVGALALAAKPFALRETIAAALAIVTPEAEVRGFEIECTVAPDVPDAVVGDSVRIKQVVAVLTGLAIEQTLDGPIRVDVQAEPSDDGALRIALAISSDSVPLSREAQTLLGSGGTTKPARLGLGAMARLAHMLGEGISYASKTKPAVFRLGLRFESGVPVPCEPNRSAEPTAPEGDPAGNDVAADESCPLPPLRLQVLLVDDENLARAVTVALLKRQGYAVVEAAGGDAALAALEEEDFDLVLMDIEMPDLNGYQTAAAVRERERLWGRHVPIVALTAAALEGERERCLAVGMDGHLAKPIRLPELRATLAAVQPGAAAEPGPMIDAAGAVDREGILARVGGADAAMELTRQFAEQSRRTLGALRESVAAGEPDRVTRTAIRLRGTLGGLGARTAQDAAQTLESLGRGASLDQAAEILSALETQVDQVRVALEALSAPATVPPVDVAAS